MKKPIILVVGAGFGGLKSALYLHERVKDKATIRILSDSDWFCPKPDVLKAMFYSDAQELSLFLPSVFSSKDIDYITGRLIGVDPDHKTVFASCGTLNYDFLILATGTSSAADSIPGLSQHAILSEPVRSLRAFGQILKPLMEDAASGAKRKISIAMAPHAARPETAFELLFSIHEYIKKRRLANRIDLEFITPDFLLYGDVDPRLDAIIDDDFAQAGITCVRSFAIASVDKWGLYSDDQRSLTFDCLIALPPLKPAVTYWTLPGDSICGVETRFDGVSVPGYDEIFVVGDGADTLVKQAYRALDSAEHASELIASRLLKQTFPSVRKAPHSVRNLQLYVGAKPLSRRLTRWQSQLT